ncbi:MAG: hypothetical protein ACLSG9_00115 [Eubacterium sp.]
MAGIDVELAREACRRLGYKPVFRKNPLGGEGQTVRRRRGSLSLGMFFYERQKAEVFMGRTVLAQPSGGYGAQGQSDRRSFTID